VAALDQAAAAGLRVLTAVLTIVVIGAIAAGFSMRDRSPRARLLGHAAIGAVAAGFVFDLQSGTVGAGIGGAVLAAAAGAVTVLLVMLFRNV
jgi:hypothetical protein